MNKTLIIKVIALCFLCSLITGIVVYAATPSTAVTISAGHYPNATSYTIFKDGSTYYAKNSYGAIIYSGTNATTVFQAIFDLNPDTVLIKEGTYDLNSIEIDSHCHITGEGWDTILDGSGLGNGEYIFVLNGSLGSEKTDVTIENLYFYTGYSGYVGGAIYMNYVYQNINIKNNQFECGEVSGSSASAVAIRIDNSNTGIVISDNRIEHYTYRGINLQAVNAIEINGGMIGNGYAGSMGVFTYGADTVVRGVNFGGGGIGAIGVRVGEGSTCTVIKECYFELNPSNAIVVGTIGSEDPVPETTIIKDNYFDMDDPNYYFISVVRGNWTTLENNRFNGEGNRAIWLKDGNVSVVTIKGVYLLGTIDYAVVNEGATDVTASGYGFEVMGTADTSASTSVTVTHGLYGTPTNIMLTTTEQGAGVVSSSSAGATTFQIDTENSGDWTVAYHAWYIP